MEVEQNKVGIDLKEPVNGGQRTRQSRAVLEAGGLKQFYQGGVSRLIIIDDQNPGIVRDNFLEGHKREELRRKDWAQRNKPAQDDSQQDRP
jgi:hypothetical protein